MCLCIGIVYTYVYDSISLYVNILCEYLSIYEGINVNVCVCVYMNMSASVFVCM